MDVNHLSASDQKLFLATVNEQQRKEFSKSLVGWTELCFNACVNDFTSKALAPGEEKCIKKCFQKSTDAVKRMGMRFAEQNHIFNTGQTPGGTDE